MFPPEAAAVVAFLAVVIAAVAVVAALRRPAPGVRAPPPRGGFGELMLERLLADCLPAGAYETQFTYRDGSRVDAIVHSGGRIVPIDAKFPNESYTQIGSARDDGERRSRRRAFLQQ